MQVNTRNWADILEENVVWALRSSPNNYGRNKVLENLIIMGFNMTHPNCGP